MIRTVQLMAGAALSLALAASASAQLVNLGLSGGHPPFNPSNTDLFNYQHDDGTIEDGVGITGTSPFDIIWLNQFTVNAGNNTITDIQAAIGSPLDTRVYNGLSMSVLLYSDATGGSPADATLLTTLNTTVANANTGLLNNYDIPDTVVSTSTFFVAVLMRNVPGNQGFVASIDNQAPHVSGVSYAGFTISPTAINENNLSTLGANLGTIEGFGLPGNWALRATGVPAPGSLGLLAVGGLVAARRRRA